MLGSCSLPPKGPPLGPRWRCHSPLPSTKALVPRPADTGTQDEGSCSRGQLFKEEGVSTAISPQTLLQSSCFLSSEGPTRPLAVVLKKISLEGRAEKLTFQKCLWIPWWRPRFLQGSPRVLCAGGPATALGSAVESLPVGSLPEQRGAQLSPFTPAQEARDLRLRSPPTPTPQSCSSSRGVTSSA